MGIDVFIIFFFIFEVGIFFVFNVVVMVGFGVRSWLKRCGMVEENVLMMFVLFCFCSMYVLIGFGVGVGDEGVIVWVFVFVMWLRVV